MPRKPEDKIEVGMKISKLTVVSKAQATNRGSEMWNVVCECGNELIASDYALRTHGIRSCGCSDGHDDLTGQRFGKLVAVERSLNNPYGRAQYLCKCDCGNEKIVTADYLKRFHYPNCGCETHDQISEARTLHGLDSHPLTPIWRAMISRCENENNKDFKHYGGRGIKVCDRWHKIENFIADMEEGYRPGLQIDRIDNDGPYSPDNCRWVTRTENARNKRNNRKIATLVGNKTIAEQSEITGVPSYVISRRLKQGVPEVLSVVPKTDDEATYRNELKGKVPDKEGLENAVEVAVLQAQAIKEWGFGPAEIELGK